MTTTEPVDYEDPASSRKATSPASVMPALMASSATLTLMSVNTHTVRTTAPASIELLAMSASAHRVLPVTHLFCLIRLS